MKGVDFAKVKATIAKVFNPGEFDLFLYEKLEFRRVDHVPNGPFLEVVAGVLMAFDQMGRDADLIAAVAAARPRRADVQEVYRDYAEALLSEAQRQQVEADKLAVLESYGLAPSVDLRRGKAGPAEATAPTHEGFQKTIRGLIAAFDPVPWTADLLRAQQRVCRIEVGGRVSGSGFLVGPDAVLTNYHVVKEAIEGKLAGSSVECRFDYRLIPSAGTTTRSPGVTVPLLGQFADWHLDSSPALSDREEDASDPPPSADQLDHALVRLAKPFGAERTRAGGPVRGWLEIPASPLPLFADASLMILHYPLGEPIKLNIDTQGVLSVNPIGTRVRYATNTDYGSSGSPCFDLTWGLVALHHFGDPFSKPPRYNQGVPIRAVRDRLERAGRLEHLGGVAPDV